MKISRTAKVLDPRSGKKKDRKKRKAASKSEVGKLKEKKKKGSQQKNLPDKELFGGKGKTVQKSGDNSQRGALCC